MRTTDSTKRIWIGVVAVVLGLSAAVHPPARGAQANGTDAAPVKQERVESRLRYIHKDFEYLGSQITLTDEQKKQLGEVEKTVAARLRADPSELDRGGFGREWTVAEFRRILTPEQIEKLDKLVAEAKQGTAALYNSNHLKQIVVAAFLYANEHGGALPRDLGSLIGPDIEMEVFLAAGSPTKASDVADFRNDQKATWVNERTDFVYLGAGKIVKDLRPDLVLGYVKPERTATAGGVNSFLMGDGRVLELDAAKAAKVLADLREGKNPPPSFPKE